MKQIERSLQITFQIDTNRINSRGKLPNMTLLEQWHANGVIRIEMSEVAQNEAGASGDRRRTQKADSYNASHTLATTPQEQDQLRKIERVLFPSGAKDANERNDVEIVFNAGKYFSTLVTFDVNSKTQPKGILGSKQALEDLGIKVMTDEEAVAHVKDRIRARDEHAVWRQKQFGLELPEWVGKDA